MAKVKKLILKKKRKVRVHVAIDGKRYILDKNKNKKYLKSGNISIQIKNIIKNARRRRRIQKPLNTKEKLHVDKTNPSLLALQTSQAQANLQQQQKEFKKQITDIVAKQNEVKAIVTHVKNGEYRDKQGRIHHITDEQLEKFFRYLEKLDNEKKQAETRQKQAENRTKEAQERANEAQERAKASSAAKKVANQKANDANKKILDAKIDDVENHISLADHRLTDREKLLKEKLKNEYYAYKKIYKIAKDNGIPTTRDGVKGQVPMKGEILRDILINKNLIEGEEYIDKEAHKDPDYIKLKKEIVLLLKERINLLAEREAVDIYNDVEVDVNKTPLKQIAYDSAFNDNERKPGKKLDLNDSIDDDLSAQTKKNLREANEVTQQNRDNIRKSRGEEVIDEEEEKDDDDVDGKGKATLSKYGLSNEEIDKMMKKYPEYLGTISHDEIISKIVPQVKPHSRGCFIINTDPASKSGEHWQALFYDASKDMEIDWYDSYGDPADKTVLKGVKKIADKLEANTYLKFKENRIVQQNASSSNCGFFCIKFLIDRLNGKHFKDASGYNDAVNGEHMIGKFKKQMGYGSPFKYIKSFAKKAVGVVKDGLDRVKVAITGVRSNYPPNVRKWIADHGSEKMRRITIVREPINKYIDKALNLISLGGWEKAKSELGYSDMFHLFVIIDFEKGEDARLERNHVIEMYKNNHNSYPNSDKINVPVGSGAATTRLSAGNITFGELMDNAYKKHGPALLKYSGSDNNCQIFVRDLLSSSGLYNSSMNSFVMQDAKALVEKLHPAVKKVMDTVTDVADRADALVNGTARRRRKIYRK